MNILLMKTRFLLIALLFTAGIAAAQNNLKGTIVDAGNNEKLSNVFIKNLNNKQITLAESNGKFVVPASVGNLIVFSSPGYASDTLYVINMEPKTIKLQIMTALLKEVSISGQRERFDPRTEYPEIYTKSKVYILSPSSLFSRDAKNARRLKKYFAHEEQERQVDDVFNVAYVSSIVPLKGVELQSFMAMYRPSYAFIQSNAGPSLAAYINDSYKKFKELPPEKKAQSSLQSQ